MAKTGSSFFVALFGALITVAMIGTPLSTYAADECDATISPEGLIHIPVLRYLDQLYTVDLQYHGTSGSRIDLSVENVQPTTQDCPVESELTSLSPFTLEIVSLAIGSANYDITLSDNSGQQTNVPRSPNIFDKTGDGKVPNPKVVFNIGLEVIKQSLNSDVWKGKSACTRDVKAHYPGATAYATSTATNVTFTRDHTAYPPGVIGQSAYKVSTGQLKYRAFEDYDGMKVLETAATSAMEPESGTIQMGIFSAAAGTAVVGFDRTGTAVYKGALCNYSGTAEAEWLYIPQALFGASSAIGVMRRGTYIELNKLPGGCNSPTCFNFRTWSCTVANQTVDIPVVPDFTWIPGDLTCNWSFKYYPE